MPNAVKNVTTLSPEVSSAVAKWLDENCFIVAKNYREKVIGDPKWITYRNLREGDHWTGEGRSEPLDYPGFTANMIMPTIDTAKGIALLTPPLPEFVPPTTDPGDEEFAKILNSLVGEFLWNVRKGRRKLSLAWDEAATVGTVFAKPFWNPKLYDGDGDVDLDIIPAEEIYLDPTGRDDAEGFVIHASRRPVIEIKYDEQYNDFRLEVASDAAPNEGQKQDTAEQWVDLVTCKEYWIRDYYLKALMEEIPEFKGQVNADGEKFGMQITVASGNVIKHNAHPWMSERLPFPKYMYYPGTGNKSKYGTGDPHYLKDAQYALDDKFTQFMHMVAMLANKQRVVSDGAILDESELNSIPGQVIHVTGPANAAIHELDPGSVPPAMTSAISMLMRLFEIIPGMYEVNRGDNPGSVRAGVAIQALQRGGEGRTAQKSFNFDDFVVDIAMVWIDIMSVMYDGERVYRVTGVFEQDPAAALPPEIAAAVGEEVPADMPGAPMAPGAGSMVPAAPVAPVVKGYKEVTLDPKKFFDSDGKRVPLDARVRVGMMIRSWDEWMQKMTEWMGAGIVDAEYAIQHSNLPGKEELLQRLGAMKAAAEPAAEAPVEPPLPAEGSPGQATPEEMSQMQEVIDMLVDQIRELETGGLVPPGTADSVQSAVEQEISSGGDGSVALQAAQELIDGIMQSQGGAEQAAPAYGVQAGPTPGMPGM